MSHCSRLGLGTPTSVARVEEFNKSRRKRRWNPYLQKFERTRSGKCISRFWALSPHGPPGLKRKRLAADERAVARQDQPNDSRGHGPPSEAWVAWVVATVAMFPVAGFLWLIGGYGFCGTDTTDPGPIGDAACRALVEPIAPWATIAAAPLISVGVLGFIALRRRNKRLFILAIAAPYIAVVATSFALLAIY